MKIIRPDFNRRDGFMLIDSLVYGVVLLILIGIAYLAMYRSIECSVMLRRNGEDVAKALQVGELWRADMRATRGPIRFESVDEGQIVVLPCAEGDVSYQFTTNSISRRAANGGWSCVLPSVTASTMEAELRNGVSVWRWELELKPRSKRQVHLRPLFTFLAVPGESSTK